MKRRAYYIFLVILMFAMIAGDTVYCYSASHQPITLPQENRTAFAHAVIAVDFTGSMSDDAVAATRRIVNTRIISSAGPGDRVVCLAIGPRYGLASSVFGSAYEEQPPQLTGGRRAEVSHTLKEFRQKPSDPLATEALRDLTRSLAAFWTPTENVRRAWGNRLNALGRPKRDGTSIRALLDGIRAEFEGAPRPQEQRWIFILSDLLEQAPAGSYVSREPADKSVMSDVHIVLVYPHNSDRDWEGIKRYWRDQYFNGCDVEILPFSKALDDPFLLPPHPLAGFENIDVRTAFDFAKPVLVPEALLLFGLLCAYEAWCLLFSRSFRRSGFTWGSN